MPLVIQCKGPYAAPQIICDHCGEIITDAKDGNYQWSHTDGCEEGQTTRAYFTHKRCCHAFEQAQGGRGGWGAIGLEGLPYFLAKNLKVSWRTAQAQARLMAGF